MTNLLVKIFVKNNDNTNNQEVRTSYGVLASIVGIICNVILFGVKLVVGLVIRSISVQTDAANNLSDAASSIISLIGVKIADKPADKEHPFGHGRMEYISALIVSFLIMNVGLTFLRESIVKIMKPEKIDFNPVLVGILAISILIKIWLMLFNKKLGKRINSSVMKAAAADSMGDILVTFVTVASVMVTGLTGIQIDGYVGILVSIIVMIAGFKITKETLEPLLGQAADREVYDKIAKMVENYNGIVGTHDLIVHSYGPSQRMATIHAEVPNDIDFEMAHETIDQIEKDVMKELDIFLVIHMDPIEVNDTMVLEKKQMVMDIVEEIEPKASIHDFRMVNGEHQINLLFDLVIPYSYNKEDENEILHIVVDEIRKRDLRYQCIITLENSYVAEE